MLDLNNHRIIDYLDKENVNFSIKDHEASATSTGTAHAAHVPGRMVMKAILLMCDDEPLMLVLPSTHRIDFDLLKRGLDCKKLQMASRDELSHYFPDCMVDAIPPFGNLYDMDVLVEQALCENDFVYFHPGVDDKLIEMHFNTYEHLLEPKFVVASVPNRFQNT